MTFSSFRGHSKSEWHWNDWTDAGMTGMGTPPSLPRFVWNDPGMTFLSFQGQSCHSGMRISGLEWWDDAEMTWMSLGWAHSIVMPSFQCHPIILVSFHHSKNSKQGGLTLASLRFQKVSPPNPLCRGGWVDWLHAWNDRNDSSMIEWSRNDGMMHEWVWY